jgi:hypothetical protein
VFSGNLTSASPVTAGRLSRDASPSGCGVIKAFPGQVSSGSTFRYATGQYTHSGPTQCVVFRASSGSCVSTAAFLSAYSPTFDPANKLLNYVGDTGASGFGTEMGLLLTNGQTVTLAMIGTVVSSSATDCSFTIVVELPTATHDFDNDDRSDIVWRQNTGVAAIWRMNGATLAQGAAIGTVPANWHIVGQFDFNRDGKHDLLWYDISTGSVALWFMNGTAVASTANLGAVTTDWVIVGIGRVNGDIVFGADLLWRNLTTGGVAVWRLASTGDLVEAASLGTVSFGWSIAALKDLNGDGKADILWRNTTTGDIAIWFMNGTQVASATVVGNVPVGWSIVATGDFNGDGKADLVWRHTSGDLAIWLMNGSSILAAASLGNVPTSWIVAETGDFNGDSSSDLLLRNTATGDIAMWFMNGLAVTGNVAVGNVGLDWTVQGVNAN